LKFFYLTKIKSILQLYSCKPFFIGQARAVFHIFGDNCASEMGANVRKRHSALTNANEAEEKR
jgi:uncharacterized membrane protein